MSNKILEILVHNVYREWAENSPNTSITAEEICDILLSTVSPNEVNKSDLLKKIKRIVNKMVPKNPVQRQKSPPHLKRLIIGRTVDQT